MSLDRGAIDRAVDEIEERLVALSRRIHDHPELSFEEHDASRWIAELVEEVARVPVERPFGRMETALRARAGSGNGPRIALLAEYDALPEIGHACGHNLIAGASVGAFLALARHASSLGGTVELLGTPAEEAGGGKIRLLEAGAFEGVDAAMMFHPFDRDVLAHPALTSQRILATFHGAPAHAAFAPWDGRSALTACLDMFRLVDSQRLRFRDGVRVHGIVTEGGQAANIVVERAQCEFSIRAPSTAQIEPVVAAVERCARAAALASEVTVEIEREVGYREMQNNLTLARRFGAALEALGRRPRETDSSIGAASTDMGDVSLSVPAIHPWLAICKEGEALCHQRAFADCAKSESGFRTMLVAAKALARTALDLFEDPELVKKAHAEYRAARS
ncbi:MAG TPA: M20 family metallopeptidase [Polyangiaceae bacterium]